MLTAVQVYALADAISPRYRAMVLLAAFASLRWGELAGLRRCDIDPTFATPGTPTPPTLAPTCAS